MALHELLTDKKNGKECCLSPNLLELLQYRINEEEKSARLYHNMVLYFKDKGYDGAAKVWQKYSEEELIHASWAQNYLLSLGIKPDCRDLTGCNNVYTGLKETIHLSFEHELEITRQCQELASEAMKAGDHMLYRLALKYLEEQIEEQNKFQVLIDRLETFGDDKISLQMLDNYLLELFD